MRVAIITASTLGYKGEREDKSGPYIKKVVENAGFEVKVMKVLPDDRRILGEVMKRLADSILSNLIITTGGTGFSESDVTPEATLDIVEATGAWNTGGNACLQYAVYKTGNAVKGRGWNPQTDIDRKLSGKSEISERITGIYFA